METLLDTIKGPRDVKKIALADLPRLAQEIRTEIIDTVSRTGGHLASSLGAVDLTIALHHTFDFPRDSVLWDVGHQVYAHKILTGRRASFPTIRQFGGLSGFPNKDESPFDLVTTGHASTSISTALGLVAARDLQKGSEKVVVVIGDASLAGGMSFEALNHAGHLRKDLIIILNDNELSISPSIGALSRYLNRVLTNPTYNKIRKDVEKLLMRLPRFGFRAYRAARRLEEGLKNLLVPGMLFEELGFRYFGPIDGHNISQLITTFRNVKDLNEPILIHVVTKKGKGYRFAEERPGDFHGTGPFSIETGEKTSDTSGETFTDAFGAAIAEIGGKNPSVIGITAAMIDGTGFNQFAKLFPDRFFDVGISEEHAVTFAGGLALAGKTPVVAVYSTFLQRGYDQIVHDVCLQRHHIVFCLDRAGIVGEDGGTHQGLFDIAYLRHLPGMTVMAPRDPSELKMMLDFAVNELKGPVAIRYPKGSASRLVPERVHQPIKLGKAEIVRDGRSVALLAFGSMVDIACEVADQLVARHVSTAVINARFAKPVDAECIDDLARRGMKIVTLEEGVIEGGFGSAVLECIERQRLFGTRIKRIGLPSVFLEHGKRTELFSKYHLTPDAICDVIINELLR